MLRVVASLSVPGVYHAIAALFGLADARRRIAQGRSQAISHIQRFTRQHLQIGDTRSDRPAHALHPSGSTASLLVTTSRISSCSDQVAGSSGSRRNSARYSGPMWIGSSSTDTRSHAGPYNKGGFYVEVVARMGSLHSLRVAVPGLDLRPCTSGGRGSAS